MRSQLAQRLRSSSLSAVPPPQGSAEWSPENAKAAASILYRSPIPSQSGHPVYIVNAAALPDAHEIDFDALLPYVLARLPGEEELLTGTEYEVIFFAGGNVEGATSAKKDRPGWGWFIQAYHVLSRAMRKRIQKLYIVHEKSWVRILVEMFSTIVSPKFRRKIIHVSTLSSLALHIPIEDLLIPPSAYLYDRRLSPDISAPYNNGRRAFSVQEPFPKSRNGTRRLPRVLRETTAFILYPQNILTEGLFRIPPHTRYKEILQEAYSRGQKYIIWKDNGLTLPVPNYDGADGAEHIIEEVDPKDAYSIHLAAGLLKSWYTKLSRPLFPQSTYQDLKKDYADPLHEYTLEQLTELISPRSKWSKLPALSREIMTRHLLPFLSIVAAHQGKNKMTAENLAVCFAPALLCGPDQIEDAKMSSIIRRILAAAIEHWPQGLREACGVDAAAFERDIQHPEDPREYEDPLERYKDYGLEGFEGTADEKQFTGIVMQDNEPKQEPPPLPPRPSTSVAPSPRGSGSEAVPRRKPAPAVATAPRYSTVIAEGATDMAESPVSYHATTDGLAPTRPSEKVQEDTKSGTEAIGSVPQVILPKRKALTAEQISQAKDKLMPTEQRSQLTSSESRPPVAPKLANIAIPKRKPVHDSSAAGMPPPSIDLVSPPGTSSAGSPNQSPASSMSPSIIVAPTEEGQVDRTESSGGSVPQFRKPSLPASARKGSIPGADPSPTACTFRGPTITSLARPVYGPTPVAPQPMVKSATLPTPTTHKIRTPSPNLLKRMPSFEPTNNTTSKDNTSPRLAPKKLNLKQSSVDQLRKLYEERTSTARTLVEAGLRDNSN